MVLVYTSFGFGLCALVAALVDEHVYCGLLIALNSCSILHHAHLTDMKAYRGGTIIGHVDRTLAHIITAKCLFDTVYLSPILAAPIWLSVSYVALVYKNKVQGIDKYVKNKVYYWHASIHIASQLGLLYRFSLLTKG